MSLGDDQCVDSEDNECSDPRDSTMSFGDKSVMWDSTVGRWCEVAGGGGERANGR